MYENGLTHGTAHRASMTSKLHSSHCCWKVSQGIFTSVSKDTESCIKACVTMVPRCHSHWDPDCCILAWFDTEVSIFEPEVNTIQMGVDQKLAPISLKTWKNSNTGAKSTGLNPVTIQTHAHSDRKCCSALARFGTAFSTLGNPGDELHPETIPMIAPWPTQQHRALFHQTLS